MIVSLNCIEYDSKFKFSMFIHLTNINKLSCLSDFQKNGLHINIQKRNSKFQATETMHVYVTVEDI